MNSASKNSEKMVLLPKSIVQLFIKARMRLWEPEFRRQLRASPSEATD